MSAGTAGKLNDCWGAVLRTVDKDDASKADLVQSADGGKLIAIGYHWNTNTLAYEVNTGGTTAGTDVTVTNFPANPSTSTLQTTGNSSLSSIDAKTPALGQQLAAASIPVVLTASQLVTLTPPAALTNYALESGNLASIKAKTDNLDVLLSTRLKAADTLAGVTTVAAVTSITNPVAVTGTFFQTTQPVSIAATLPVSVASLPLPTNASTESGLQAIRDSELASARVQTQFLAFQSMMSGGFLPIPEVQ